jgi:hypothetical protein
MADVFQFNSSAYLEKLTGKRAFTLDALLELIKTCSDTAIFYHTFSALRKLLAVHAPYTNDFAVWVSKQLQEEALSEKLGAINLTEYETIESLRAQLLETISSYRNRNPAAMERQAAEPFFLCDVIRIVYLTDKFAYDLKSFREQLDIVSFESIYYHFIESRLTNPLYQDDFSIWIEQSLQLKKAAAQLRQMDINVFNLPDLRANIIKLLDEHLQRPPSQNPREARK